MIYREFQDIKISALAMGTMRLPVINGVDADIDAEHAEKMVDLAYKSGVNYFDTAWGYHNGNSELVMGKALAKYDRSTFYLADKFPGYDLDNMGKVEEIFESQLKKCGVEYFDFYLIHNVCELNIEQYLDDEKYHTYSYLMAQKKAGRIRHLGFSTHGALGVMRRFLDAYGKDMEFCQIQLNYVDWEFQGAKEKVELLTEYNLPVWVMEPFRGGKLAAMAADDEAKLKALRPDATAADWCFRFLQSVPQVTTVLTGASTLEQMRQNIESFAEAKPLDETEMKALLDIAASSTVKSTVPCTACHYCVAHCPQELDIPTLLSLYNEHAYTGGGFLAPFALQAMGENKGPSACLGCRSCEAVCPQQIKISEVFAEFNKMLSKAE